MFVCHVCGELALLELTYHTFHLACLQVTRLQHPSFGQVAFVAVGATLVGSVELLKEAGCSPGVG